MRRKSSRAGRSELKRVQSGARPQSESTASSDPLQPQNALADAPTGSASRRPRITTALAVIGLLTLHFGLAARSLIQENPTVDEVLHLPAGVSYWQKGTFRLYHHNPPLVKLVAALPVVWAKPNVEPLYSSDNWRATDADVSHIDFGLRFAALNVTRYFELFRAARLMMPLFSLLGGIAVFAWSRRLYGSWGGVLSLALWVFCPNILAHARLVTSDLGATALGVVATYAFWRYVQESSWKRAILAGIALGLAALSKFSMVVLYVVWPFLWLVHLALVVPKSGQIRQIGRGLIGAIAIVVWSVLVIDAGYFFEGVGVPLKDFEFGSRALTTQVAPGTKRPHSRNQLFDIMWQFRVNRFRGTWLGRLPMPLPRHYLSGFDEQKVETEGVPERYRIAWEREFDRKGSIARELAAPEPIAEVSTGYPVYLNGELRRGGWWNYYFLALAYKVPEGTWLLVILSGFVLVSARRTQTEWANEIALATVPAVILFSISFLTDINLGLRYVLPIAPYAYIAAGKVVPWLQGLSISWRRLMEALTVGSLSSTVVATLLIHPHYLAYFNWASGGPDRIPARLIDSNLDWGQDLVGLREWWEQTIPGEPLGLVYFGQINPSIFAVRHERFRWFLPPPLRGTVVPMQGYRFAPPKRLEPGYYAVSATALYGLPWRYYDPTPLDKSPEAWLPAWNVWKERGYSYFRRFSPIGPPIGHSIYVFRLSEQDVASVADMLEPR